MKLGAALGQTQAQFDSIEVATGSVDETVRDFDSRIALAQPRIDALQAQLQASMRNHAQYLQQQAEVELLAQRERLLNYQAQARYALASLYDDMSARNP